MDRPSGPWQAAQATALARPAALSCCATATAAVPKRKAAVANRARPRGAIAAFTQGAL